MGRPSWNIANTFDTHKTRMIELPCGEESMKICYTVSIEYRNATDGQTHRQTDGRTDGLTDIIAINIARQYTVA